MAFFSPYFNINFGESSTKANTPIKNIMTDKVKHKAIVVLHELRDLKIGPMAIYPKIKVIKYTDMTFLIRVSFTCSEIITCVILSIGYPDNPIRNIAVHAKGIPLLKGRIILPIKMIMTNIFRTVTRFRLSAAVTPKNNPIKDPIDEILR